MTTIQIQNEVINYLNSGARVDFFHNKNTKSDSEFEFLDSPMSLTQITINVYYQNNGKVLKSFVINQPAAPSFIWSIAATDFANDKPLNYFVDAVNQNQELLFYGAFTLN